MSDPGPVPAEQRYYAQPMEGRDGRVWEVIDRFGADKYPGGVVFATAQEDPEARAREYAADANGHGADSAELVRAARRVVNKWVEMGREYRDESDSNGLGELLDQLEDEVRRG